MPITLSHPAAVLPLRRIGLSMTVMVIGSLVPDIPLFAGWTRGYEVTHSMVGVLTVDVALTIAVLAIWLNIVRDALVDLSPPAIRSRFAPDLRLTAHQWMLVPVAAVVGATTHVVWDSFTHPGRWGVRHIAWLRDDHGGMAGLKWAQYASGGVGLIVVVAAAFAYIRDLPNVRPDGPPRALAPIALYGVVGVAVLVGLGTAALEVGSGFHAMAFHGVINSLDTFVAGCVCVCVAWQVAMRSRA